jgi:protein-disulfide isomerase
MNSPRLLLLVGIAALGAVGLLFGIVLFPGMSGPDVPTSGNSRQDIEQIVRNYLLENPEVIFEAAQRMEQKEKDQRQARMTEGASKHAADLFNRPGSIVVGNPKGDVTIVEFFDYRCGPCRRLMPELAQLLKQDGNVRLIMKEFPILSPESELAAQAALAASRQGKYWDFHLAMMQAEEVTPNSIMATAKTVGLDIAKLNADMESKQIADVITRNRALAESLGVDATPTFYVGETPYAGALPLSELKEAVAAARRKAGKGK